MAPPEEPKVEPVDDLMDMNTVTMPEPAPVEQTPVDMTVDVQQPVAEQPQVPEQPEDLMGDLLGGVVGGARCSRRSRSRRGVSCRRYG